MPRLLAPGYVYSEAMDESISEYIESAGMSYAAAQRNQSTQNLIKKSVLSTFTTLNSNPLDTDHITKETSTHLLQQQQQIHSISSSDEDFVNEQNTTDEKMSNMSSEESSDFEGFDDYTTINSNGLINETSREDCNTFCNYLKQHSHIYVSECNVESEDYTEDVEVEDEDEEIAIGEDGKIIYRSTRKVTPKRSQTYRSEPYTPNKRKKELNENCIANSTTQLKTPPDQIVEVNSDSTTNSLKEKRLQINNKFQLNLSQQQKYKININPNKCSTESTSEFPVSSPSNPQQARGGKYLVRPPLLKNTLPADSFERQLAMITTCNPQMTLAEKIQSWECEEEPSDLEDVKKFDEEFKRLEKQKKLEMKQKKKGARTKNSEYKNYDFFAFQKMILKNIEEQKHQKYRTSIQSVGCGVGTSGAKGAETSGSESSKSVIHVDDRPSTSAVAQQQLQQRRSKHHLLYFETGEPKKRVIKDIPKRNQNSTTPPQTSSSDNERDCFNNTKNNTVPTTYETLVCGSSSEETTSQDMSRNMLSKANNKYMQVSVKNLHKKSPARPAIPDPKEKLNEKRKLKNCRTITNEEIQSFFRPNRLNREIDKYNSTSINQNEEQSNSIIQMRLDFTNENKTELLSERKQELFKTPIVPQKYFPSPLITAEYQGGNTILPTRNEKSNEDIRKESLAGSSLKKANDVNNRVLQDKIEMKSAVDDIDGVYHQQHEFCNYLGLTGMSTATAMANAVAELAQCNLARRSMRVFRQQQQERREKSAKEERLQEALKLKQLKEVRKREKRRCDIIPVIDGEQANVLRSDEGTHSQSSEPAICFIDPKKKSNNCIAKSSRKSRNSKDALKKDPEIKILCHIATKDKEEAEKLSPDCTKETTQPISETVMRFAKQRNSDTPTGFNQNSQELSVKSKSENIDSVGEISLVEKENILSSTVLSTGKSVLKNKRSRSQVLCEERIDSVQSQDSQAASKLESVCDTDLVARMTDKIDSSSQNSGIEGLSKEEMLNEQYNAEEERLFKAGIQLISSAPSIIQKKMQMALEASRKSKPSIFIVQSLESKKEKSNNLCMNSESLKHNFDPASSPPKTIERQEINIDLENPVKSSINKYNTDDKRRVYKTRKIKKYPTSKRQLRNRKIIVIKTLKSKHKSHERFNAFKRELRSSLRTNENKRRNSLVKKKEKLKQNRKTDKVHSCNESKSFRTVHTETKDLELYVHKNNNQTKKRLMAKASALLERSRRMTLRGSCNLGNKTKFTPKIPSPKQSSHDITETYDHIRGNGRSERKKIVTLSKGPQLPRKEPQVRKQITTKSNKSATLNLLENENVVVSSTTNTYDEKPSYETLATPSPTVLTTSNNTSSYVTGSPAIKTQDQQIQCSDSCGLYYLNSPPSPIQVMRNPLKPANGTVLYIYNELDVLIVVQDHLVSFWKCSKLINILLAPNKLTPCTQQTVQNDEATSFKQNVVDNCCNSQLVPESSIPTELNNCCEWIQLGELRRINLDIEISAPYSNRICLHNSTPIYLEMRAQQLPKNQRECNLLSMYINIYYYHDEDMIAKCNSIPLDSIQSDVKSVNYTTLTDSRYFIITWPQENLLGKTRSGLCKYSLTPQLDTLASIREFKSMRHTIRHLECMSDDKLIGFGDTQVSIWDYRSGDVLMNFDFEIPLGKNLGSIYFSSQDIEQNNMLILHQFRDLQNNAQIELMTLACTVTHSQPSYKVLQATNLPTPAFKLIKSAIKTGDHLVVTGQNEDELWISLTNPRLISVIPNIADTKRFYSRERSQLIELTEKSLNVNSLANHVLQLAAGLTLK